MSQLKYWVWLSMRFGVRPKVKLALVEHFGTPRDVYFARTRTTASASRCARRSCVCCWIRICMRPSARSPSATGRISGL